MGIRKCATCLYVIQPMTEPPCDTCDWTRSNWTAKVGCASCEYQGRPTYEHPCNVCGSDYKYWECKSSSKPNQPEPDPIVKIDIPIYDQVETYHNCTVQILSNSITGQTSIGWWQEEDE